MEADTNKKDVTVVNDTDTDTKINKTGDGTSSSQKSTEKPEIRGWLKVFLYVLGLTCVSGVIGLLINVFLDASKGFIVFQIADILRFGFIICLSIIAINKFVKKASNAIFYGRAVVVMCALGNIMYVLIYPDADDVWKSVARLLWWVAWFFFLEQSSVVQEVYPPESRKVRSRDWALVASIILIPWAIVLIGYLNYSDYARDQLSDMASIQSVQSTGGIDPSTLAPGELSDGNIAFKVPSTLTTEEQYADSLKTRTLYAFNNGNKHSVYGLVTSYKCNSWNKTQFSQTWNSWIDNNLLKLPSKTLFDGSYMLNGSTCYEKHVSYQGSVKIYLDLATVYNKDSRTLCLVRIEYAEGEKNPMKEILKSVRFK